MTRVISAAISSKFNSALSFLRAGQRAQARAALLEVVSAAPDFTDAHWLLAGVLFESGDPGGALNELHAVIRLDPNRVAAHVMAGRVLAALGRLDEAAKSFRRALEIQRDPATAAALARILIAQNQAEDACSVVEPYLASNAPPDLLLLHGHALMMLKRPERASESFGRLVAVAPRNSDARLRFSAALCDSGKYAEAEAQVRSAIAQGSDVPEARFVLGRALMGQNRMGEAEPELRRVVRANPLHVGAQNNLCELLWMRSGDVAAAGAEIDAALHNHPGLSPLRISKARLLLGAEDPAGAMQEIEKGLAITPDDLDLNLAAAQTALGHDAHRALVHSARALQLAPGNLHALSAYGDALLATGDAGQAIAVATELLRVQPEDGRGIALLASARRMAGDPRTRELFDYDNFVRAQLIDVPAGWQSLRDYLHELAAALHRLHSLKMHPIGQSLRGGSQLELDFDDAGEPAIAAFPRAIHGPISRYVEALGHGADPMRKRNIGRFRIRGAWSVRLKPNGFHVNHFHPEGWISSACYIELPPAIDAQGHEGWLQLGEPGFKTQPPLPPERFVKPEPGLLALFPSYMWHGTIPFSGDDGQSRLTIAFDVVPG